MERITKIAETINQEISWFEQLVNTALSLYFKNETAYTTVQEHTPPDITTSDSVYATLIKDFALGFEERLVLIIALLPYVKPQALDVFLIKNQNLNNEFAEFGGIKDANRSGFIPSLETAIFILTGQEIGARLQFLKRFNKDNVLFKQGILEFDGSQSFDLHQKLILSNEYLGPVSYTHLTLPTKA